MNKDFKNGIIGLLMFMGIILLLGFVETTIEMVKSLHTAVIGVVIHIRKVQVVIHQAVQQARLHLQAASQEVVQVRLAAQAVHQK
jgi:hypothetical protein